MKHYAVCLALVLFMVTPAVVLAVDSVDFEVQTTKNLLNLCTVAPQDELYAEAINFCHGYLIGAYHYHHVSKKGEAQVCVPEPQPSRNAMIGKFISWAESHPQYNKELPVETEFRFLMETWPCSK